MFAAVIVCSNAFGYHVPFDTYGPPKSEPAVFVAPPPAIIQPQPPILPEYTLVQHSILPELTLPQVPILSDFIQEPCKHTYCHLYPF